MFCTECGNHAANKALRKLGIKSERKKTVVTFDGLLGGKETFPIQLEQNTAFVKVSDTAIVPDKVNLLFTSSGAVVTIESKDLLSQSDNGLAMYVHQGVILVITVEKDMDDGSGTIIKGGTYVRFEVTRGCYVSSIESTTETIHPIDQKYLPGGSIRMDAYGNSEMTVNDALLNLALEGGGTTTFASGMEPFWADVLAKQPDYLIFNVGDNLRMPICVLYATEGSVRSGESCISANGLLSLYGTNLLGYFVMAQTKDGKGVKISVKSEPVIFPETALAEHGGE